LLNFYRLYILDKFMLEAIEKRFDPVKVHKIVTEYFKAFRSERGLIEDEKLHKDTKNDLESTICKMYFLK
jgi:hypothetical protein